MRKAAVLLTILMIFQGLLAGCKEQDPLPDEPIDQTVSVKETEERGIPIGAERFTGLERYQDRVDYSDSANWLSLPRTKEKNVDVIFLYPTVYGTMVEAEEDNSARI